MFYLYYQKRLAFYVIGFVNTEDEAIRLIGEYNILQEAYNVEFSEITKEYSSGYLVKPEGYNHPEFIAQVLKLQEKYSFLFGFDYRDRDVTFSYNKIRNVSKE